MLTCLHSKLNLENSDYHLIQEALSSRLYMLRQKLTHAKDFGSLEGDVHGLCVTNLQQTTIRLLLEDIEQVTKLQNTINAAIATLSQI